MSEEQRNQQPHDEREGMGDAGDAARRSPGRAEPGGSTEVGAAAADADADVTATATGTTTPAMADVVGEGSPRYGDTPDEIPVHGSEQSWSAAPHPGYVADPKLGYSNQRVAAGVLIGCLVLALGVFYGVRLLTGRSSNGFGAQPWTAAVQQHGAVVNGINAQNSGAAPPIVIPSNVSFGTGGEAATDAVQQAITTCQAAANGSGQPVAAPATSVANWASQAGPTIGAIRAESAKLSAAVAGKDPATVAAASKDMCSAFARAETLPPMPDAEGAKAWVGGISDYAEAASNAIKGVSGDPQALLTAADDLKDGDAQFAALTARLTAATA